MTAAFAVALAFVSTGFAWITSLTLAGQVIHPSLSWIQTQFPEVWQRGLLLAAPITLASLGISNSVLLHPSWGSSATIVASALIPVALSLWLTGGRLNGEITALVATIGLLGLWLANALQRTA